MLPGKSCGTGIAPCGSVLDYKHVLLNGSSASSIWKHLASDEEEYYVGRSRRKVNKLSNYSATKRGGRRGEPTIAERKAVKR